MAEERPVRVLLVEDPPEQGEASLETLAGEGHDLIASDDLVQALHIARALHPDVIVLDVTFPGAGGLSSLRRLRADRGLDAVPVVTLSSEADDEEEALEAGAVVALHKPLRDGELNDAVVEASANWLDLPRKRYWGGR